MYARSKTGAGFTIVETMIFLGISALMFVLAINAMSGKQQQTEFQTAVDTLKSSLNLQMSNVANGNYPSQIGGQYIGCSGKFVSGKASFTFTTSATPIPPDSSCTVVGEVIAFAPIVNNQEQYYVIPVFGCNYVNCSIGTVSSDTADQIATNLSAANPNIDGNFAPKQIMPFGLTITDTVHPPAPTPTIDLTSPYGSIGIFDFTSFENNAPTTNNFLSTGSQHVEIVAIPHTPVNSNSGTNLQANVNNGLASVASSGSGIDPASGISFCVNSGTDNESAFFTLGGGNSPTSISYKMYDKLGCID